MLTRMAGAPPRAFTAIRPSVAPRVVRVPVAQAAEAAVAEPSTEVKTGVARLSFQRGSVFKASAASDRISYPSLK
jgi:hypothetical protein